MIHNSSVVDKKAKIGNKVTVNFEDMGKLVIDGSLIALEMVN